MTDFNSKLETIYPYSYNNIKKVLRHNKRISVNKVLLDKTTIATPSTVRQILNYSYWAMKTEKNDYKWLTLGAKGAHPQPGDYVNMIRNRGDKNELDKHFNTVSIIYELLVTASLPNDIRDIKEACKIADINRLESILNNLSWAYIKDRQNIQFLPLECDQEYDEKQTLKSLINMGFRNDSDPESIIYNDLLLNLVYPHLYPRLKEALESLSDTESHVNKDAIIWYIKDDYEMINCELPRISAIDVILKHASWSCNNCDNTYDFDCTFQDVDVTGYL